MTSQNHIDRRDSEDEWQEHIIAVLWVVVAIVIILGGVLAYGVSHGLVGSPPDHTISVPPWPGDS
jgi:hypothetical protein